ncbi:MAG TPA: hemerythrin family protein [Anaeromyxobacter sp.]
MIVELEAIPQVAVDFVNADHRREGQLLNELAEAVEDHRAGRCPASAVSSRWDALFVHTREHFGREEAAMQRTGFPPYPVHKFEHDRVLEQMKAEGEHFRTSGDADRLWKYVSTDVPSWFVEHIETMDTVTAQFIASRGG